MLWKKESIRPDALYVDMFAPCRQYLEDEFRRIRKKYTHPMPQKDDAVALEHRNRGNNSFRSKKWFWAIELYNESLRYALPGSQHISLAYANRASCFLKLNMFDKCLKDIELAKENGYPEHLMHKLEERKAECLQQLADGAESYKIGGQLSYDADENFPCMANVLEVQTNINGSSIVVAKEDIDVNQIVVVEDAFHPYALKRYGLLCNICMKRCENLQPCEKCAVAMFCPSCKGHYLHKYECGLSFCGQSSYNGDVMAEVRNILMVIKMFTTADELMAFIKLMQNDPKKMPANLIYEQAKYQAFFNSPLMEPDSNPHYFPIMVYPVYHTVLRVPEISAMFKSQKHLRFLMHLIGHHALVQKYRPGFKAAIQPVPFMPDDDDPFIFVNLYHLMDKYFQHSCRPNVLSVLANGQNTMVAVCPIKKGEQLFESRIPIANESKNERQHKLWNATGKTCLCERCRGITANEAERRQLSSEPLYQSLECKNLAFRILFLSSHDLNDKCEEVIADCVMLLRKHGRIQWCDELKTVLSEYQAVLYNRLAGGLH